MIDIETNSPWLFVFRQAPLKNGLTAEALDLLLVAASFEVHSQVLFLGDGVEHIKSAETQLPYLKTFRALPDFEVNSIFVLQTSLQARDLTVSELTLSVDVINEARMRDLLHSASRVFHF